MKYFGLLAILITISIGVVLSMGSFAGVQTSKENGEGEVTSYQSALDSAKDAADSLSAGGRARVEIYSGITYPVNVTQVDLSGQNLSGSLMAEVRLLSDLEELNISDNNFTGVPAEVGQLTKLRILNLANNPLTGLPRELGQLQNLEILDLSGTQYSEQDLIAIQAQLSSATVVITQ